MRNFDPLAESIELKIAEVFDLGEVVHSAESRGDDHEEDFPEMVFLMMTRARIFED